MAGFVASEASAGTAPAPAAAYAGSDPAARHMYDCSYALWYPWFAANHARSPNDAPPPKPEPDGPRDPPGEKCLAEWQAMLVRTGQRAPRPDEIVGLRAAARAGKTAASFESYNALKASRNRP